MFTAYVPMFSTQLAYTFWNDMIHACFGFSFDDKTSSWIKLLRQALVVLPLPLHQEIDYVLHTVRSLNTTTIYYIYLYIYI